MEVGGWDIFKCGRVGDTSGRVGDIQMWEMQVGGWEMQQKPGFTTLSKLPRTIQQNFPRESSTTFEAFSLLAGTKISRRNVETFFARHLRIFI